MPFFQDSSGIGCTVDAIKLWGAVAKYVGKISKPDDLWYHLTEAVKVAISGRPEPVVLMFSRDIFEQEVEPYFAQSMVTTTKLTYG
ncbi:MAG: hypothetical protein V7L25_12970 [Nostoc sp.]|uniref:hypothetical protein n=1 Tax=Nostoc sp. TaxID=1180 RepID=UPI002FF2CE11